MTDQLHRRPLTFTIQTLLVGTALFAMFCWAPRNGWILAALLAYAGVSIFIMVWYARSDVAMSICAFLVLLGALLLALIAVR